MSLKDVAHELRDLLLRLAEECLRCLFEILGHLRNLTRRDAFDAKAHVVFVRDVGFVDVELECRSRHLLMGLNEGHQNTAASRNYDESFSVLVLAAVEDRDGVRRYFLVAAGDEPYREKDSDCDENDQNRQQRSLEVVE